MSSLRRRRGGKEDEVTSSKADSTVVLQPIAPAAPLSSPSLLAAAFVFAAVLTVYLLTTYPSVTGGDAGELIITGCNFGVAHPPGYPTFTMLAGLFQRLIPYGSKAWRTNVMSSIFGSIAAVLLYATGRKLGSGEGGWLGDGWGGMLAALGFAFSPTVWLYSIQGEVFALNNLLVAAMVYLTVLFYEEEDKYRVARQTYEQQLAVYTAEQSKATTATTTAASNSNTAAGTTAPAPVAPSPSRLIRLAYAGAFVCGVAMTNQHTTVFPVIMTSAFVTWSLFYNGQLTGPCAASLPRLLAFTHIICCIC